MDAHPLSRAVLADMVRKTLFSVAEKTIPARSRRRPCPRLPVAHTTAVSLFLVGTDGHRLAEGSHACESGGQPLSSEHKIVVH